MRNDLVHHFVDRFDLSSDGSRRLAIQHLEACAQQIESQHQQLRSWARSMDNARALAASFLQTDIFENLLIDGIAPIAVARVAARETGQLRYRQARPGPVTELPTACRTASWGSGQCSKPNYTSLSKCCPQAARRHRAPESRIDEWEPVRWSFQNVWRWPAWLLGVQLRGPLRLRGLSLIA